MAKEANGQLHVKLNLSTGQWFYPIWASGINGWHWTEMDKENAIKLITGGFFIEHTEQTKEFTSEYL